MPGINPVSTPRTQTQSPQATRPTQATPAPRPQQTQTTQQQQPSRPLAQTSGSAGYSTGSAFEARTSGTLPGGIQGEAHVAGPSFSVNGNARGQVGRNGVDVNLSVDIDATLAQAGARAERTFSVDVAGERLDITVDLGAQGNIGANGRLNLDLHIGTNGNVSINAGAQGFAGARGAITGGIRVQHEGREMARGSLELSGTVGVSGSARANIGLSNGNLTFDVGAEAAVVGGFGTRAQGSVNAPNTARFAGEVALGAARQGADWAGGQVRQGANWAGDQVRQGANWAGNRVQDVRSFIGNRIPSIDLNPFN